MWSVRILSGPHAGQIFDLKLGKNTFGRGASCDFKVQSVGISKEHCEIHVYKDKAMIVDLKSSNGTFVNGVKIQNSIIQLGDKLSLFDIIMDVIPTPDLRPKPSVPNVARSPVPAVPPQPQGYSYPPPEQQNLVVPQFGNPSAMAEYQYDGANAYQQNFQQPNGLDQQHETPAAAEPKLGFMQKVENYIENVVMPAIYRLAVLLPFKQVLLGFVLIFILGVTLLSLFPLTTIVKESNFIEASRRAKAVARALARYNEQALLSGQFSNLNVAEALNEDGVKEAIIIQQSDGAIVAPPEKAGREVSKPFVAQARKESRSAVGMIDANTIGATHPLGVYDVNTGESTVKYHAIVYYDISSLNVDESRIISLFMQTLVISSVLGMILYFIFARLIQYPLKSLNFEIDKALREKSDHTEVPYDYPEFQQVVSNVNLILNRMWSGASGTSTSDIKPQQNRDLEFSNMLDMLTQPSFVLSQGGNFIAINSQFEQLISVSKDDLLQQNYENLTDHALRQNVESLVARATNSPYDVHSDVIPFAQFECRISIQASLGQSGEAEYFFVSLTRIEST